MTGLAWVWPSRVARWRKPALVAASVVAHVVVLGLLSYRAMGLAYPALIQPPQPIYVEMEPRPLLPGEKARPRPTPVQPAAPDAEPRPSPTTAGSSIANFRLPFQRRSDDEDDQPRSGACSPR